MVLSTHILTTWPR